MIVHRALRIAAAADLHYTRSDEGKCRSLFSLASLEADVLVLAGDLTEHGAIAETRILAEDLTSYCRVPVIAVLGNHDSDSGHEAKISALLREAGVTLLEGDTTIVGDVGFAGVCGSGGGFSTPCPHEYIRGAAASLESALNSLATPYRVAVTHFAPIQETLVGESPRLYGQLGTSALELALDRGQATVAFHGHAHAGSYAGRTGGGIGVFNVAVPVLQREFPQQPPFVVFQPRSTPALLELVEV